MSDYYDINYKNKGDKVKISELHMATADYSDETIDKAVSENLLSLRKDLSMDAVFVSEFTKGKRVLKYVDSSKPVIQEGDFDDLENSWCKMVVDGKLPQIIPDVSKLLADGIKLPDIPFIIGTHLSVPIVIYNNEVYGTLCCFSFSPNPKVQQRDLEQLKSVANLVAKKIENKQSHPETKDKPLEFVSR